MVSNTFTGASHTPDTDSLGLWRRPFTRWYPTRNDIGEGKLLVGCCMWSSISGLKHASRRVTCNFPAEDLLAGHCTSIATGRNAAALQWHPTRLASGATHAPWAPHQLLPHLDRCPTPTIIFYIHTTMAKEGVGRNGSLRVSSTVIKASCFSIPRMLLLHALPQQMVKVEPLSPTSL